MNEIIHLRITPSLNSGKQDFPACHNKESNPTWSFQIKDVSCPLCLESVGKVFCQMVNNS